MIEVGKLQIKFHGEEWVKGDEGEGSHIAERCPECSLSDIVFCITTKLESEDKLTYILIYTCRCKCRWYYERIEQPGDELEKSK